MLDTGQERFEAPVCLPKGAHYCEMLNQSFHDGISVDVRRYGWNDAADGTFAPEHLFIDYAIVQRPEQAFMVSGEGRRYLRPGAMVFMAPGANFLTHCEPSDHLSLCLSYDLRRLERLIDDGSRLAGLFEPCIDLRSQAIERYMRRAVEEVRNPGFAAEVMIELISDAVMVELARHFAKACDDERSGGSTMAPWRLRWLKDRIADGLGEPLSVAALAQECGISPRHLVRTFKNSEGMTLSGYISAQRIARAKELLAQGVRPIKVVAHDCGFASASSFSVAFLNAIGQTPRQFRESHCSLRITDQPRLN
jgi:AraC family transcriptional regulator